jgi:ribosome-binding protein aMBF1 (putative translation factor)
VNVRTSKIVANLRKGKCYSCNDLVTKSRANPVMIGKYESWKGVASIDEAKKIDDAFEIFLDYSVRKRQNTKLNKKLCSGYMTSNP